MKKISVSFECEVCGHLFHRKGICEWHEKICKEKTYGKEAVE